MIASVPVLWTPVFRGKALSIMLDRTFGDKCAQYILDPHSTFQKRTWVASGDTAEMPSDFIPFQQGILPKGIYRHNDGVWLTLDSMPFGTSMPYVYHGHNEERPADCLWLLKMFGAWSRVAELTIRNKGV